MRLEWEEFVVEGGGGWLMGQGSFSCLFGRFVMGG